jgi:uncharacterized protein (TIGR02646 family)
MIFVKRTDMPASLANNAQLWVKEYLVARVVEDENPSEVNKKARKRAEKKYAQDDVRKALSEGMFNGKCAFCERKKDYPEIEHFYPKSTYPEKCFEWENLILSCKQCNMSPNKGIKFPLSSDGQPLFINPCEDDPADHISFVFERDDAHPDGFIATAKGKTERGRVTIEEIGLNRPNLLKERTEYLLPYFLKLGELAQQGDKDSLQLLQKASQSSVSFSAFARVILLNCS